MRLHWPIPAYRWMGVLLLLLGAAPYAAGQCYYTYQQIAHPSGGWIFLGEDLNELGHVAGLLDTGGESTRVGFWSPETGVQFVPKPAGIRSMEVGGLNDHDVICGSMRGSAGPHGFLWDRASDQVTFIDLPEGAYRVEMNAINNANHVAATLYFYAEPTLRAAIWRDGDFHPVAAGFDAPYSRAEANSDDGETAGDAAADYWGDRRGYLGDGSHFSWLPHPTELTVSFPESMSNNGYFGGRGTTAEGGPNFAYRGIVWTPGGDTYVISPPPNIVDAFVRGINDAGRAIGDTYDQVLPGPPTTAFVWQQGVQTNLNTLVPGLSLRRGLAINNRGQILAQNATDNFVLTPVWLPGDLTGDCHVSAEDLILVLSNFGMPQGSFPRGDVDLDGDVDLFDLTILLAHWGE